MVLAILSLGTSNRRCEYSQAMVLPFASTIVVTAGTSPSSSCAEALPTTSEARLDTRPTPPTTGNSRAATTTLANRQHATSFATVMAVVGRSGMATRLAALRRKLSGPVFGRWSRPRQRSGSSQSQLRGISAVASAHFGGLFMIGLHGRAKKGGMGLLRN